MTDASWSLWNWPFFDASHHDLARRVTEWNGANAVNHEADLALQTRAIVKSLGDCGLLEYVVPSDVSKFDVRALCVIREALTYQHGTADSAFTMQGIGTIALQQFGTPAQKERYLEPCRRGRAIAAFALTEPDSGSDVASMTTSARRDGDHFIIDGEKTLISNAGFADHYLVVARTGEAPGSRGLSAFIVDADTPGLSAGAPIDFIADHPAAPLSFKGCRIPVTAMVGEAGQGFKVAMGAFDIFRPSVGAAAVGLAQRALNEAVAHVRRRVLFGKPMGELQSIQMTVADMAADLDSAALTVYRAAWERDVLGTRGSYGPSMAKLVAAEAAGRIVDRAVQLCGGAGVTRGNVVEQLYREARPMRIYEGTSEVQKLIIGRAVLKGLTAGEPK